MEKKYELIDNPKEITDCYGVEHYVYQIRALKDFGDVRAGDLGGWIESEKNLSHDGFCWVYGDGVVAGNAEVRDDAFVSGLGMACGNAVICEHASVGGKASICGSSMMKGAASIHDHVKIFDESLLAGNTSLYGLISVRDKTVLMNVRLCGDFRIVANADIRSKNDIVIIEGIGRQNRTSIAYKTSNGCIIVCCGCFTGYLSEFEERVIETYGRNEFAQEYLSFINIVKIHFWIELKWRCEHGKEVRAD